MEEASQTIESLKWQNALLRQLVARLSGKPYSTAEEVDGLICAEVCRTGKACRRCGSAAGMPGDPAPPSAAAGMPCHQVRNEFETSNGEG